MEMEIERQVIEVKGRMGEENGRDQLAACRRRLAASRLIRLEAWHL